MSIRLSSIKSAFRQAAAAAIFSLALLLAAAGRPSLAQTTQIFAKPTVSQIEEELIELINRKRAEQNLRALELSPKLSDLAREHSLDMAEHRTLMSLSSEGSRLIDRVAATGLNFMKLGEDLAYSETFRGDLIYQELTSRSNSNAAIVRDPNFDSLGIGIVDHQGKGYYVTLVFRQSIKIVPLVELEWNLRQKINVLRRENDLDPLLYSKEASEACRDYSKKTVEDLNRSADADKFGEKMLVTVKDPSLGVPPEFGETLIVKISSPQFPPQETLEQDVLSDRYVEAGVGAWFDRSPAYPGGAYFITLFLFHPVDFQVTPEEELAELALKDINQRRSDKGLGLLQMDKQLARQAEKAWKVALDRKMSAEAMLKQSIFAVENPRRWPAAITERIENPSLSEIGICIKRMIDPLTKKTTFWISFVTGE